MEKYEVPISEVPIAESERIRRTLKDSIRDGQFWGVMNGIGTSYLSAFAVYLGGSAFQLGLLASVPQLLASLFQLLVVKLVHLVGSRKRFIVIVASLQALMWIVAVAVSLMGATVWVVIGLACMFFVFQMLAAPAWSSLIGDLVPENQRGRYFGRRNRSVGFVSFVAMAAGGLILDALVPEFGGGAYAVLFGIAFLGRAVGVIFLARHYDPDLQLSEPEGDGVFTFLRKMGATDFGRLVRFNTIFHVATFIISPLFVVYFLEYLKVTYWEYSIMLAAAAVSNFLTIRYWGLNADRFGNRIVLTTASWVLSVFPFLWFGVWYLPDFARFPAAVAIQVIGGLAWAGYNLSVANFQFDSVERRYRVKSFGHYNLLHGVAMFTGGTIGGFLADTDAIRIGTISGVFFVMLLSGVLRLLVCFLFLPGLRELRKVKRRPFFLYFLTVMPVEGLHADVAFGFSLTKRGLREKLREVERRMDWGWLGGRSESVDEDD